MSSRRQFLRQLGGSAALIASGTLPSSNDNEYLLPSHTTPSGEDPVRIAGIGMGIMGFQDVATALKVPGVSLVAAADLYDGRLRKVREVYGEKIFTTRDYRQILDRKDVDAVIIATSDHWHVPIAIEALKKGKAVYCEKPLVHKVEEGQELIRVQRATGRVLQVGSQGISSSAFAEAKRLFEEGAIGSLNCIEATNDRHSALGAWQYSIPPDASPATVDWSKYLRASSKRPFDATRFFRWRNYQEFGTGVAGDLFVHLVTGVHFITGAIGPKRIFASGQLSYWKDGRDVPDVMTAILDYPKTDKHPEFQLTLRVNFASGNGEKSSTKFIGTEGVLDMGWGGFTIRKEKFPSAPGYGGWDSYETFPKETQEAFKKQYDEQYPPETRRTERLPEIKFKLPDGYDDHYEHFVRFFDAVRGGKPVVEDAEFGLRAAGPCLACNESYFKKKIINWDPVNMRYV